MFNWEMVQHAPRFGWSRRTWAGGGPLCVITTCGRRSSLGSGSDGLMLALPPTSCRLLAVRPAGRPSRNWWAPRGTSPRAPTTCWRPRWDPAASTWSGRSRVVAAIPTSCDSRCRPVGPAPIRGRRSRARWRCSRLKATATTVPWRIAFRARLCDGRACASPAKATAVRHGPR